MELKGSRTEANLMSAFSGESMARNKYTFYAAAAKKAGMDQVARVFQETAHNEEAHAKIWLRQLGKIGNTVPNLTDARDGERFEWSNMYADYENVARTEGFTRIAELFKMVGEIEKTHDDRYSAIIDEISAGTLQKRDAGARWKCSVCGRIQDGAQPPEICPVCNHSADYYEQVLSAIP